MGKLKRALTIAALPLFGLAVLIASVAVFTSRSSFCVTCHYMQPFYDSWRQSSHNKVECIECHFAPGLKGAVAGKLNGLVQLVKYTSLTYKKSRPWAEIPDESCLRAGCHETRLLKGRVNYKEGVVFDHAPHLGDMKRGKKLRCTSCHSQIVQGLHITVTATACYLCHFKEDGGIAPKQAECAVCHAREVMERRSKAGELRYDHGIVLREKLPCQTCHSHTVMGTGPVAKQNCFACHWDNERLSQFNNTSLMHTKHISENKIECMRCHLAIEHKLRPGDAKTAADCQTCHPSHHNATITLFTGEGASGVPSLPNRMFLIGLNCRGCHISHGLTAAGEKAPGTYYASGKSCDSCHGRGFSNLIKTWQRAADDRVAVLKKAAGELEGHLSGKGSKDKLAALRGNLAIVERGNIVHNVRYANEILDAARASLANLGKQAKISLVLPTPGIKERKPNADCLTCHFYLDKAVPLYAGLPFNHKTHSGGGFECQRCHSIAVKHAELTIDKSGCAPCHHKRKITIRCEECHTLQNDIIQGRWNALDEPSMKSLDFPCTKCHLMNGKDVTPEDCATCHKEPAYAEKMRKGVKDIDTLIDDLTAGVARAGKMDLSADQKLSVENIQTFVLGIANDGSHGMHNPKPIKRIAKEFKKKLDGIAPPPATSAAQ